MFAGGASSRFYPVNGVIEKSLLPLPDGRPIIRRIVDNLISPESPIKQQDIILLCAKKYEKAFRHEFRDVDISFDISDIQLGTFGHLVVAANSHPDELYLVHYADMVIDINYDRLVTFYDPLHADATIATFRIKSPYSEVVLKGNQVTEFIEKPWFATPVWTGVGVFNKSVIQYFNVGDGNDIGSDLLPILADNNRLTAFTAVDEWKDLGTIHNYQKYIG